LLSWGIIGIVLAVAVSVSIGQVFRPYATLADAAWSDRIRQVKGRVVEGTIVESEGQVSFVLQDIAGTSAPVRLVGPMPPRLREAGEVVVIGRFGDDGVFVSRQILVRCPTKY
jgi:cytochrome c-type biogenesis protein CcmE